MGGDGARVGVRTQAPCQTEGWWRAAGEKWPVKDRKPEPRFQGVRARVAKLHCAQTVHTGPVRSHGLVHCAPGRSGRRIKRGTCSRVDGNRSRGNGGVTRTQQRTRKPSNAQPGLKGRPAGGGGWRRAGHHGCHGETKAGPLPPRCLAVCDGHRHLVPRWWRASREAAGTDPARGVLTPPQASFTSNAPSPPTAPSFPWPFSLPPLDLGTRAPSSARSSLTPVPPS